MFSCKIIKKPKEDLFGILMSEKPTAIEQRNRIKNGQKTRQEIPLKDIIDHEAHFPYLKEEDLAICKALVPTSKYIYLYGTKINIKSYDPRIYHNRYKSSSLTLEQAPEIYLTKSKYKDNFIPSLMRLKK